LTGRRARRRDSDTRKRSRVKSSVMANRRGRGGGFRLCDTPVFSELLSNRGSANAIKAPCLDGRGSEGFENGERVI
jgi:hypothetical protein